MFIKELFGIFENNFIGNNSKRGRNEIFQEKMYYVKKEKQT